MKRKNMKLKTTIVFGQPIYIFEPSYENAIANVRLLKMFIQKKKPISTTVVIFC